VTALFESILHFVLVALSLLWSFAWRYIVFSLAAVLWIKIIGRKLSFERARFFTGAACLTMIAAALVSSFLIHLGWYGALSAIFVVPVTYIMIRAEAAQNLRPVPSSP
jgi:hypothetical protein